MVLPRCKNGLLQVILGTTLDNINPACYGKHATLTVFLLFGFFVMRKRTVLVIMFLNFCFGLFGFLSYIFGYVVLQGNHQTSITFGNIGSNRGKERKNYGSTQAELLLVLRLQPELEINK